MDMPRFSRQHCELYDFKSAQGCQFASTLGAQGQQQLCAPPLTPGGTIFLALLIDCLSYTYSLQ